MEKFKKVSRAQWCLFALLIGFAFLMQNCQDDDALIYEENQTETELNARPVSGKVDVCRYNARKDNYSIVSVVSKRVLPDDVILDFDGDGYVKANECKFAGLGIDCDDTNVAIYPGAVEICGDDIDNNCDGVMDDGCTIEGKTFVPNDNFEQALISLGLDGVLDNYVDTANINTVTTLNLSSKEIGNLTGIEDFADLEYLECWNNSLTRLDLSKNTNLLELFCRNNALTELIVSNSLVYIDCGSNSLNELDLSANFNLIGLDCGSNIILELNLSNNKLLEDLKCSDNLLTSLNVSSNNALKYLNCSYNTGLGSLNVGSNPNLETLNCYNNGLTSLDLSGNLKLLNLSCFGNNLNSLNLSNNINLEYVSCDGNPNLETLNVSGNDKLIDLRCSYSSLTNLDLSGKPSLEILYCDNNKFESLDISANSALTEIDCSVNALKSLDLSVNPNLVTLYCDNNILESLDVSQNNALTILDCSDNPNLSCIKVNQNQLDNYNSWDWWKDTTAIYSLLCPPL